jgi:hypothetical protein
MESFSSTLKSTRIKLGFPSARAFYQMLVSRASVEMNYPYYTRIEAGQVFPSLKVVNQIALCLPKAFSENLILAYCGEAFPKHRTLFRQSASAEVSPSPHRPARPSSAATSPSVAQIELSESQVSALTQSRDHYFLFLIVTLSRRALACDLIASSFNFHSFDEAVDDLTKARVIFKEANSLAPSYPEYRFPAAATTGLKQMYAKLNHWDQERGEFFGLETLSNKQMFRRVSPRYVQLIYQNLQFLYDLSRLADEADVTHNDSVVSLLVQLQTGKIPG